MIIDLLIIGEGSRFCWWGDLYLSAVRAVIRSGRSFLQLNVP